MSLNSARLAFALISGRASMLPLGLRITARGSQIQNSYKACHVGGLGLRNRTGLHALHVHALRSPLPARHFSSFFGSWRASPPSDGAIPHPNNDAIKANADVVPPPSADELTVASAAASESPGSESLLEDTTAQDIVDAAVSNVPAIMQYGDLAALGLTSWSPAGLVRWGLEGLHVSTGLPWFHVIVIASVLARLTVVPFNIMSTRDTAKIGPYRAQLTAVAEKMQKSKEGKDPFSMMRAREAQLAIFKAAGVNPLKLALVGLTGLMVQLPLSLGLFFGIKTLCEFPIDQLKYSGFSLIPDLTVPDPTYLLPLVTVMVISLQTKLMLPDLMASGNARAIHWVNALRVFIIPASYFMAGLPSGVVLSIFTSVACYTIQIVTLRAPAIRRLLDLPVQNLSQQKIPTLMDTFKHFKSQYTSLGQPQRKTDSLVPRSTPPRR